MKNKFKAVSTLITVILLVVVATIITVAILSWGNQFTNKSLDKTDGILDTKKYIENQIVVNSFVAATIEKTGNLNIKNLGPNNVTITGYTISDNEGNTDEIILDSEIEIITGASVIIPISTLLTGTKVSVVLNNSNNYLSLPTITKAPQYIPKVGNPSASLDSGYIPIDTEISLTPDNENDRIYYTTDGTTPDNKSNRYDSPILIQEDTTLKLIAIKENYRDSDIVTYDYLIDGPLQLSLGANYSCVVLKGGKINCWGENQKWQLGDGTQNDKDYPNLVSDITNATEVSAGIVHTCALLDTSEIACWGANDYGQLGIEEIEYSAIPIVIPDFSGIIKIVAGGLSTCAIDINNDLYCWGRNDYGQLGTGDTRDLLVPRKILENIRDVDIGMNHACAIDLENRLFCWGDNQYGQLGDGTQVISLEPKSIGSNINKISVGLNHTCAIARENRSICWGDNQYGQLGIGTTDPFILRPVEIPNLFNIISIDCAFDQSCAINEKSGEIIQSCWGKNDFSQLAKPKDQGPYISPEILKNIVDIDSTSLGLNHTCSIVNNSKTLIKEIYCWGDNSLGQTGTGLGSVIIEEETIIKDLNYGLN